MAKSNSFFNIDMLVLSLLKVSDCYGYELVKKIKEVSNNTLDIKEGTLYPVVHNLLKKEYISSRDEIPSLEVITIFFRTTFKPFLSICRFYRLFLYF